MTSAQAVQAAKETSTTVTKPRVPRPRQRVRHDDRGWLFVAPFLVVFALTFLAPIGYAFYLSVFREQAFFGNSTFVGAGNYLDVLTDAKFWDGAVRVMLFVLIQIPVTLLLALVAALAIDSGRLAGANMFRLVIFLPYAVPVVVSVLMWGYIYGDRFGLAADLNHLLGTTAIDPLSETWILPSIVNIVNWEFMGYNMIIFYAAMRTIPTELYEAAAIDGAGAFRTALSIKIPALRGAIVIATIFSIIGMFQLFIEPNILQSLAANVIPTYYTPNMYALNLSFAGQQYNYAATVAIVMAVITAVIAYLVQLRGTREEEQ